MNKLPALFALLLSASALAGGGGPRPVRPLAVEQMWEMDYQAASTSGKLTLTLTKESRPDKQGVKTFEATGASRGQMNDFREPYLAASAQDPFLLCVARHKAESVYDGFLLTGTPEQLQRLLPQKTPEYTAAEVYASAQKANLGTCTLKRLR